MNNGIESIYDYIGCYITTKNSTEFCTGVKDNTTLELKNGEHVDVKDILNYEVIDVNEGEFWLNKGDAIIRIDRINSRDKLNIHISVGKHFNGPSFNVSKHTLKLKLGSSIEEAEDNYPELFL